MNKQFEVTFLIDGSKLTTITELVAGECTLLNMKEVVSKKPPKNNGYLNGKRKKGIKGDRLLLSHLSTGPKSIQHLTESFAAYGFKKSSMYSVTSKLKADGLISWDHTNARWCATAEGMKAYADQTPQA